MVSASLPPPIDFAPWSTHRLSIVTRPRRVSRDGECATKRSALATPRRAYAQSRRKPRVGTVHTNTDLGRQNKNAFIAGLRDLGWIDGQNVTVDWRQRDEEIEELAPRPV